MKTKIQMLLVLSFLLLLGSGCKKEAAATAATAVISKDLFSADWYVSSSRAWHLDLRLGSLDGANFSMYANYSNGAQCACVTNISGDQTFGSIQTTCNASIPIGSVTSITCAADFGYTGTATYSNSGGILRLCRTNTTNCLNYN